VGNQQNNNFPLSIHASKIDYVFNPVGDGYCGFRVVSHGIIGDEHQLHKIKDDMAIYLRQNMEWLLLNGVFVPDDIDRMMEVVTYKASPKSGEVIPRKYWFYYPECCQLAANTFLTPIAFHSELGGSSLFLPITNTKPINMHLKNDHFTRIVYKRGARDLTYPSLYPTYENCCRNAGINSRAHQYQFQ
jgi:hypothetical protein